MRLPFLGCELDEKVIGEFRDGVKRI